MAKWIEDHELLESCLQIMCGRSYNDLSRVEIDRLAFYGLNVQCDISDKTLKKTACSCIAYLFKNLRDDLDDKQNKERY